MGDKTAFTHMLIRDSTILARLEGESGHYDPASTEFFDVRTGVKLKNIHPPMTDQDLERGYTIEAPLAQAILETGSAVWTGPDSDPAKVTSILELRQRKLDSVVADSIIDQVRVIHELLKKLLLAAELVRPEEKYWLSQQLLTFVRKFSGRELAEMDEMIEWFLKNIKR
jgi:hypothetical protein